MTSKKSQTTAIKAGGRKSSIPTAVSKLRSLTPKELGIIDLDDFIASARHKHVASVFSGDNRPKYDKAVTDLENSIKMKQQKAYTRAEGEVRKLLNTKPSNSKIKNLLAGFNELTSSVKQGKDRGNWFQYITFKDDSPETHVATNFSTGNKSVPNSEQTYVFGKLLAIEQILDDSLGEGNGAKKKRSDDRTTEDVLKSIKILCTSAVEDRARAASTDVKNEAKAKRHLQVAKEWITKFEKQMKELSQKEEEFKDSLHQSNDLDEIRAILIRLIQETKEQEDNRKILEENNRKQANTLLSLLIDECNKTGNSKISESSEEKDIKQLLMISISELNTQIDELRNQASRLQGVTMALNATNGNLVADKKTTQNKKSQDQQVKPLTAIIEKELKKLEDECDRNNSIVTQLDNEIERLEKDIEDWDKSDNVKELQNIGNCSLKAFRSARINLQKHRKENVQKGKTGDVKKLNEKIEQMCKNYGITDPKGEKDKHAVMLEQLDDRLKREKENLKTLEKELNELQDRDTKKQNGSKTTPNNTELQTLITLAQNAKTNQERLKKDYEHEQNRTSTIESNLQHLKEDVQTLYSSIPKEFRKTDQPSSKAVLEEMREFISSQSLDIQSKQGEVKKLNETIETLCKNNGIDDPKEKNDKHVVMLEQLDGRLKTENENLKTLEKELNELQDRDTKKRNGSKATQNNTDIHTLITLAQTARTNQERLKKDYENEKNRVMKLSDKITYWEAEAKREENEKLEYMNRLSKVASAKLMDNNPNIADLSDPNRQTKLAEEYSQLYDNEWTNAYEDREEKQPKESEENRIKHLLEILTTVYSTCTDLRTQQLTGMKAAILQPAKFFCLLNERPTTEATGNENKKMEDAKETNKKKTKKSAKPAQSKPTPDATKNESEDVTLGILQSQAITDLGKQTSTQALLDITKHFQSSKESWFNSKYLGKYTTKCIEICWLMNIHSPPVCLDDDIPAGSRFDKTKYREYTARGKKMKFVVWPAILLHENGPTLGKGVAQGMG